MYKSVYFQSYYSDYYNRYLEDYKRRHNFPTALNTNGEASSVEAGNPSNEEPSQGVMIKQDIEAAFLMDDIMNNGINFCAIM